MWDPAFSRYSLPVMEIAGVFGLWSLVYSLNFQRHKFQRQIITFLGITNLATKQIETYFSLTKQTNHHFPGNNEPGYQAVRNLFFPDKTTCWDYKHIFLKLFPVLPSWENTGMGKNESLIVSCKGHFPCNVLIYIFVF